MTNRQDST